MPYDDSFIHKQHGMAKKVTPRAKKAPVSKATKKTSRAGKKPLNKKKPAFKARKPYPPGKSDQVPTDLVYVADSDLHGKGMFAKKSIPADISLGLLEGRPANKDGEYVLWLTARKGLEVSNDFRFINHSSNPNCALTDIDVVTLRRIKPHEELTHDYGW